MVDWYIRFIDIFCLSAKCVTQSNLQCFLCVCVCWGFTLFGSLIVWEESIYWISSYFNWINAKYMCVNIYFVNVPRKECFWGLPNSTSARKSKTLGLFTIFLTASICSLLVLASTNSFTKFCFAKKNMHYFISYTIFLKCCNVFWNNTHYLATRMVLVQ